jgi:hypothetical protein
MCERTKKSRSEIFDRFFLQRHEDMESFEMMLEKWDFPGPFPQHEGIFDGIHGMSIPNTPSGVHDRAKESLQHLLKHVEETLKTQKHCVTYSNEILRMRVDMKAVLGELEAMDYSLLDEKKKLVEDVLYKNRKIEDMEKYIENGSHAIAKLASEKDAVKNKLKSMLIPFDESRSLLQNLETHRHTWTFQDKIPWTTMKDMDSGFDFDFESTENNVSDIVQAVINFVRGQAAKYLLRKKANDDGHHFLYTNGPNVYVGELRKGDAFVRCMSCETEFLMPNDEFAACTASIISPEIYQNLAWFGSQEYSQSDSSDESTTEEESEDETKTAILKEATKRLKEHLANRDSTLRNAKKEIKKLSAEIKRLNKRTDKDNVGERVRIEMQDLKDQIDRLQRDKEQLLGEKVEKDKAPQASPVIDRSSEIDNLKLTIKRYKEQAKQRFHSMEFELKGKDKTIESLTMTLNALQTMEQDMHRRSQHEKEEASKEIIAIKKEKMDMVRDLNATKIEFTFALQQYQVRLDDKQSAIERLEKEIATLTNIRDGDAVVKSCSYCLDAPAHLAFASCGHLCACYECIRVQLKGKNKVIECPHCRKPSSRFPRVYLP